MKNVLSVLDRLNYFIITEKRKIYRVIIIN